MTWRRNLRGTWTNLDRRMTMGRGMVSRSLRKKRPWSASTISALPSITRRSARRTGTSVNGSNDVFSAKHRACRPIVNKSRRVNRERRAEESCTIFYALL